MTSKATPKAGLTLVSHDNGDLKFLHSSSASADFDLKHKFHKRLTLGAGFTVVTTPVGGTPIVVIIRSAGVFFCQLHHLSHPTPPFHGDGYGSGCKVCVSRRRRPSPPAH
jgi:hypothetical protein